MPFGLFDYIDDSFHTMGAGNMLSQPQWEGFTCPDGWKTRILPGSETLVDPCLGHRCPVVKAPKCQPGEKLFTSYGTDRCRTPKYYCMSYSDQGGWSGGDGGVSSPIGLTFVNCMPGRGRKLDPLCKSCNKIVNNKLVSCAY